MAYTTQYIGSRYVPLFAEPAEWDSTRTYEPLTIVMHDGNSYTSRQYVPVGIKITNEKFWALTGNYNAQVEAYRREVATLGERVTTNTNDITTNTNDIATNTNDIAINKNDIATNTNNIATNTNDIAINKNDIADNKNDIVTLLPKADFSAENTVKDYIDSSITNISDETEKSKTYVTPEMYGAKGDGISDDTVALQSALDSGFPVVLKPVTYAITDTLNLNSKNALFGLSRSSTLLMMTDKDCIHVTGKYVTINGITIRNANSNNAYGVKTQKAYYLHMTDFVIDNFSIGLGIVPSDDTSITTHNANSLFEKFEIINYASDGIYIEGSVDQYFNQFMLHAFNNISATGIHLYNKTEAINFTNGCVFRGTHPLNIDAIGYDTSHISRKVPSFNRFTNVYFDTGIGSCIVKNSRMTIFDGCWFSCGWVESASPDYAVRLTRTFGNKFLGCQFLGGIGGAYTDISVSDLSFDSCTFTNCNSSKVTTGDTAGIYLKAGENFIITNCSFNNQLYTADKAASDYGIYISNSAHIIKIAECYFNGNVIAPIYYDLQSLAQLEIISCIGASNYSNVVANMLFNNAESITFINKYIPATIGNVAPSFYLYNASQNTFAIGAINTTTGTVTINTLTGSITYTGTYDTTTKEVTITPSARLWNQTVVVM